MTAKDSTLTQEYLKSILHYDLKTGVFIWLRIKQGINSSNKAGWINSTKGYRQLCIDGKTYQAHRLAFLYMTGILPPDQVDHINHIRDDNRWKNLRLATNTENQRNTTKRKDNTSGVPGVYWHKRVGKWQAGIGINGKFKHLGYFNYYLLACLSRKSAEYKYNFHHNHGMEFKA